MACDGDRSDRSISSDQLTQERSTEQTTLRTAGWTLHNSQPHGAAAVPAGYWLFLL